MEAGGASVHHYSLDGCKAIAFRRRKLLIFQNIRSAAGSHPSPVFMLLQPKHLSDHISHELPCRAQTGFLQRRPVMGSRIT